MIELSSQVECSDGQGIHSLVGQAHFQYNGVLKRVLDLALCLILLPVVSPVILVLYLLALQDGGHGFFGHQRCGHNGRLFKCLKIRTMVPDAECRLETMLKSNRDLRQEWARSQKLRLDPRVTPLGRVLRRTGLDELPQIWNVIRGDMSLIGPRPITEQELKRYGRHRAAYIGVRPGITGLWQVSGRNDLSYAQRIKLDQNYAENVSFQMDIRILLKTFGVVWQRTGC